MKTIKNIVFILILSSVTFTVNAQNINWGNLKPETRHLLNINAGLDYGLVYGIGYGYQLNYKMPVMLDASVLLPSGENLLDDFKTKIGGQVRVLQLNNFHFTASVHGLYRRHENSSVRMQNFGSEMTAIIGYYKPKWFVAGEFGFDKAIVTHFKHADEYKEFVYAGVKDGWYEPSSGGNFNYGMQAGFSLKKSEITLAAGKLITQDFKTTPYFPFYARLGINIKINEGNRK